MASITRRAALAGGTALAIGDAASAQPAPAARAKGPLVWLDMDQKALDDALLAYRMNGEMLRPENGYPLRLVVPFPPGGGADNQARLVADVLARRLGQTIIVENLSSAGGIVAVGRVARACLAAGWQRSGRDRG